MTDHSPDHAERAADKFWSLVNVGRQDECWLWNGYRNAQGYGQFTSGGRTYRAHRFSWVLRNRKEIPAGMCACHSCDTPSCVNPRHIWIGTIRENNLDKIAKQRDAGPPAQNAAKTHCRNGHEFTPENTRVYAHRPKERGCRICQNRRNAGYKAQRKHNVDRLTEDPAKIAVGLTAAQQWFIISLSSGWTKPGLIGANPNHGSYRDRRLVEASTNGEGREYRLTPLGLAVRAALDDTVRGEGENG